jgi:hypothetical protein
MKFFCKFKNRVPDPGMCRVININFEEEDLEVSNGAVRLYPKFDEVTIYCQEDGVTSDPVEFDKIV